MSPCLPLYIKVNFLIKIFTYNAYIFTNAYHCCFTSFIHGFIFPSFLIFTQLLVLSYLFFLCHLIFPDFLDFICNKLGFWLCSSWVRFLYKPIDKTKFEYYVKTETHRLSCSTCAGGLPLTWTRSLWRWASLQDSQPAETTCLWSGPSRPCPCPPPPLQTWPPRHGDARGRMSCWRTERLADTTTHYNCMRWDLSTCRTSGRCYQIRVQLLNYRYLISLAWYQIN